VKFVVDAIDDLDTVRNYLVEFSAIQRERVLLMSPQGRLLDQRKTGELAGYEHLMIVCGHYEGVDERVRDHLVDEEVSIGDYVLTGGELPAMVVMDAVIRLLPGALGDEQGAVTDSFCGGLLEHPHYTRPAELRGWRVPEVLLSGNHEAIRLWRREQSLRRTRARRPDLLARAALGEEDRELLEKTEDELTSPCRGEVGPICPDGCG
jgi:tRNA (guanine37-N1)-methyltransferase